MRSCSICCQEEFTQCRERFCNVRIKAFYYNPIDLIKQRTSSSVENSNKRNTVKNLDDKTVQAVFGLNGFSMLYHLVKKGYDVNQFRYQNQPLIILASMNCDHILVKYLLQCGADPNTRCKDGKTAMYYAVKTNCIYNVRILLNKDCDINETIDGFTYLYHAAKAFQNQIVKRLLHFGANPNVDSKNGPILFNLKSKHYLDIVQMLLKHGADIVDHKGFQTAAECFIKWKQPELLQALLEVKGIVYCDKQEYRYFGRSLVTLNRYESLKSHLVEPNIFIDKSHFYDVSTALRLKTLSNEVVLLKLPVCNIMRSSIDKKPDTIIKNIRQDVIMIYVFETIFHQFRKMNICSNSFLITQLNMIKSKNKTLVFYYLKMMSILFKNFKEAVDENVNKWFICLAIAGNLVGLYRNWIRSFGLFAINNDEIKKMKAKCQAELENLKAIQLTNQINCLEFLQSSKYVQASVCFQRSMESQPLMQFYENYLQSKFPIYRIFIWKCIVIGTRNAQYILARESFDSLCQHNLPTLVTDMIVSYLTTEDVENLIKAAK